MQLLFIQSLLDGDYRTFFIKLIIILSLWLVAVLATLIDLKTGINASKRLGNFKTTSSGLRQTLKKDFQYFTLLIVAFLFDFVFSYLTSLTDVISLFALFKVPLFTITSVIIVLAIEGISVKENLEKGRKEIISPDMMNKALDIIGELGDDKIKAIAQILKNNKKNESN